MKENREIFINPRYAYLTDFIEKLPLNFDKEGVLIRCDRNTVKCFEIGTVRINVKEFCVPSFFLNRFIYCNLRKPKAVRAYENAIKLKDVGIESPVPIAYMLRKRGGMLLKSYFVSVQYLHEESITDLEMADLDDRVADMFSKFGCFTAYLHNQGMFHGDYGNGNILINHKDEEPIFTLIDTNRMKFGDISIIKGCKEFNRLHLTPQKIAIISKSYAKERGFDEKQVNQNIIDFQSKHRRKKRLKSLKRILKG
ncbi:MAG: lipopolysaccharide kinase InaA family protein [Rikenellaceae bacterium]